MVALAQLSMCGCVCVGPGHRMSWVPRCVLKVEPVGLEELGSGCGRQSQGCLLSLLALTAGRMEFDMVLRVWPLLSSQSRWGNYLIMYHTV